MTQRNEQGYRIGDSHPQGSKYSDAFVEKARVLSDQGLGYGAIAGLLDIPKSTAQHWITLQRRNQYPV